LSARGASPSIPTRNGSARRPGRQSGATATATAL
jgi:hypothetical protein